MKSDEWYEKFYDIFVPGLVKQRTQVAKDGRNVTSYVALGPFDAEGKRQRLGCFSTEEEAQRAIKRAVTPYKVWHGVYRLANPERWEIPQAAPPSLVPISSTEHDLADWTDAEMEQLRARHLDKLPPLHPVGDPWEKPPVDDLGEEYLDRARARPGETLRFIDFWKEEMPAGFQSYGGEFEATAMADLVSPGSFEDDFDPRGDDDAGTGYGYRTHAEMMDNDDHLRLDGLRQTRRQVYLQWEQASEEQRPRFQAQLDRLQHEIRNLGPRAKGPENRGPAKVGIDRIRQQINRALIRLRDRDPELAAKFHVVGNSIVFLGD